MYNANNYGYNPYGTYIPQRPMPQNIQSSADAFNSVQMRSILNGKQVESIDVVKAMDIPLDGSISYFPLADGSSIVTKQLGLDGVSKITIYKPVNEEKAEIKYVTQKDIDEAISKIDLSDLEDIKDDIKDLKQEIKDIKKKKKEE